MKTTFIIIAFTLVMAPTYIDYGLTTQALSTGRYYEANPIAKLYVSSPAISIPIIQLGSAGTLKALAGLYNHNKLVAWITLSVLTILKALVLYHNISLLSK